MYRTCQSRLCEDNAGHFCYEEIGLKFLVRRIPVLLAALSAVVVGAACTSVGPAAPDTLRDRVAPLFGTVAAVQPAELQPLQVQLGRAIFWDVRLSLDGKTTCASCHAAADWSSDRRTRSINAKGQPTTLHSQPIFMSQDQSALRWYGDRRDGAHQAERSITGSMGLPDTKAMVSLMQQLGYEPAFRASFPAAAEPLSAAHYAQAVAAYQKTLRTPAPFDAFLAGDARALTAQQRRGLNKFVDNGCAGCHSGALLGGQAVQKFGIVKPYWQATGSADPDQGRFNATKKEEDRYVFRVAMLRNVARTAPYFHDGSVATLEQAIRVMAEVQLGRELGGDDVRDIAAFLESLTGPVPVHYAPPPGAMATFVAGLGR
jgi:cytochrome c peroxidase